MSHGNVKILINDVKSIQSNHFSESDEGYVQIEHLIEIIEDKNFFINKFFQKYPAVLDIFTEYYSYLNDLDNVKLTTCLQSHTSNFLKNLIWYSVLYKELESTELMLTSAQQTFPKNKLIKNNDNLVAISHQYEKFKKDIVNIEVLENKTSQIKNDLKAILYNLFIFV